MRRVLLALLTLALAGSAVAQQTPAPQRPRPAPVATPAETPNVFLPPPVPLAVGRPGGDPAQCRASCSRTLYFCQANGDDGCGARWAQCSASCSSTYSAPRFGR